MRITASAKGKSLVEKYLGNSMSSKCQYMLSIVSYAVNVENLQTNSDMLNTPTRHRSKVFTVQESNHLHIFRLLISNDIKAPKLALNEYPTYLTLLSTRIYLTTESSSIINTYIRKVMVP